jgi:CheY-like chemotaxis protein
MNGSGFLGRFIFHFQMRGVACVYAAFDKQPCVIVWGGRQMLKHDDLGSAPCFAVSSGTDIDPAFLERVNEVDHPGASPDGHSSVDGEAEGLINGTRQAGDKHLVLLGIHLSTQTWLAQSLGDLGFTLHSIPEAGGGVNMKGGHTIHGILWDLEASSLKGFAMVSQLRRKIPGVPVMVLANPSNKKRIIESLEQGAMDYLTKPIDLKELKNKCVRLFG